ncbi:LIM and SH3 domain protein 1 [Aplysia californica]|uniref:LIM and SH3 domain protein 1 n=1 Tax=Aplysia californica TaxID=6500 RepID=A0ABM1A5M5_APLCA|nr:LIM and SH3 domain protein 1 [Aplysia californica]
MNKKCAKCSKTVYPTEELKCLDKVWHKFCFKCEACGMTLNMKNYKGYDKLPYCNAHYPTSKHTAVADTPESRRIAENTKIQSNIQYHSEYEASKDKITAVVDTPEMHRLRENAKNFSLIQYHADFERQKGTKTSVVDDPETARIKQNTAIQSNVNYWGVREQREQMETRRPTEMVDDVTRRGRNPGKISEYNPPAVEEEFASPYSQRTSANVVYDSQRGEGELRSPSHHAHHPSGGSRPTSNAYAPFSYGGSGGGAGGSPSGGHSPHRAGSNRGSYHTEENYPPPPPHNSGGHRSSYGEAQQAPYGSRSSYGDSNPSPSRASGYGGQQKFSYTGAAGVSGVVAGGGGGGSSYGGSAGPAAYGDRNSGYSDRSSGYGADWNSGHEQPPAQAPPQPQPQPARVSQPPPPKQPAYQAIYDYTAADSDEVSFNEGDIIVNTQTVDAGWMTGTVQRTGQHGMLPSNYVERVN